MRTASRALIFLKHPCAEGFASYVRCRHLTQTCGRFCMTSGAIENWCGSRSGLRTIGNGHSHTLTGRLSGAVSFWMAGDLSWWASPEAVARHELQNGNCNAGSRVLIKPERSRPLSPSRGGQSLASARGALFLCLRSLPQNLRPLADSQPCSGPTLDCCREYAARSFEIIARIEHPCNVQAVSGPALHFVEVAHVRVVGVVSLFVRPTHSGWMVRS